MSDDPIHPDSLPRCSAINFAILLRMYMHTRKHVKYISHIFFAIEHGSNCLIQACLSPLTPKFRPHLFLVFRAKKSLRLSKT